MTRRFLFCCLLWLLPIASWASSLSICSDEWFPVSSKNVKEPGYGMEIAKAIFAAHSVQVEYRDLPWKIALEKTKTGECDALIGASKVEDRDFVFPAEQIGIVINSFYVKKDNPWRFAGLHSLSELRLGVIDQYFYDKELNTYIEANRNSPRIVVSSSKEGIEGLIWRLMFDKVDVLVEASMIMQAKIKAKKLDDAITEVGRVISEDPIYLAFSSKAQDAELWRQWYDTSIADMRSNGELQKLLALYGVRDWKK